MIFTLFTNAPMFFPWLSIISAVVFIFGLVAYLFSTPNLIVDADDQPKFQTSIYKLLYRLSLSVTIASLYIQFLKEMAIKASPSQRTNEIFTLLVGPPSIEQRRAMLFGFFMLAAIGVTIMLLENSIRRGGPVRNAIDKMRGISAKRDVYGSAHLATPKEFNRRYVKPDKDGIVFFGKYFGHNRQFLGSQLWLNSEDTARGIMAVGNAGSGKSQSFILPLIYDCMRFKQSLVVADLQKELTPKILALSTITGHRVIVHDPTDNNSPRYNIADGINDIATARAIANVFIADTSGDQFWSASAQSLMAACLMRYDNIGTILKSFEDLTKLANDLRNPGDDASILSAEICGDILAGNGGKMANGVVATLKNYLVAWADSNVRANTEHNDFTTEMLVEEQPTILILSSSEITRATLAPYFGAVITKLLIDLNTIGEKNAEKTNGALPRCVKFILDEFPAMGNLDSVVKYANLVRKRRISFVIAMQTLSQLEHTYGPKGAEILLAGMATQVVYGGADEKTAEYFSRASGTSTERPDPETKQSIARSLITPEEIIQPPNGNCHIFTRYVEAEFAVKAIMQARLVRYYERSDIKKQVELAKEGKKRPDVHKRGEGNETESLEPNNIIPLKQTVKPMASAQSNTPRVIAKPMKKEDAS